MLGGPRLTAFAAVGTALDAAGFGASTLAGLALASLTGLGDLTGSGGTRGLESDLGVASLVRASDRAVGTFALSPPAGGAFCPGNCDVAFFGDVIDVGLLAFVASFFSAEA